MTNSTANRSIYVFLPNWVGDACMATPSLRALRAAFPQARIVGIMRPVIRDLLHGSWGSAPAWFDDYVLFNKKATQQACSRLGLARRLRRQRIDIGVLLTNSLWTAGVMRLAGTRRLIGYNRDGRGWLLHDHLPAPRQGKQLRPISPVDYYLTLVEQLGCDTSDRTMQLVADADDRQLATALWQQIGFSDLPTVVINNGAAIATARLWPEAKVKQLATRIAADPAVQVLLHCGPAEREQNKRIVEEIGLPNVAGMGTFAELPIGLSKAVLERAAVVVSTDSGPRHMAIALGKQAVTLFGPTEPQWTTTYNLPEIIVEEPLPCRGCLKPHCPLEHQRCMRDISVERVQAAIDWSRQQVRRAA